MPDWLFHRAQVSPRKLALVFEEQSWSYTQLNRAVERLCAALIPLGVTPGQHVAVLLPNCPEYVFAIHALARLGAVLVSLNTRLTGPELAQQVAEADAQLLIYAPETEALAAQVDVAAVNVQTLPSADASTAASGSFNLDKPQGILFTSGTTGRSKGVVLSFANHFHSAVASAFRLGRCRMTAGCCVCRFITWVGWLSCCAAACTAQPWC